MVLLKLLLYGVSGNTVSIEDRDKYLVNKETVTKQLADLKQYDGVEGIILLSNAHRTEYYLHVDEATFSHGDFLRYLSEYSEKTIGDVILETYSKFNADAIRHLLYVLSGMDSNEENETELMIQAEKALETSRICGNCAGMVLDMLFEKAVDFSSQMQSLPSMAPLHSGKIGTVVRTFVNEWQNITKKRFLLAGNGLDVLQMAKGLFRMGARHITVANTEKASSESLTNILNQWAYHLNVVNSKRAFFAVDTNQFLYSLSSSDGIVISNEDFETIMADISHKINEIRPYKKKQLLIDLTESISTGMQEENSMKVFSLDLLLSTSKYPQEEKETARKLFEETVELEAENVFSWYQSFMDKTSEMEQSILN